MQVLSHHEGHLAVDVSGEMGIIRKGTAVVVEAVADNFKNLSVTVTSMYKMVRLTFDTDIEWLLGE